MKRGLSIYFIHSMKMDYNKLIYLPVLRSNYLSNHKLVFSQNEENKEKYFKEIIDDSDILVVDLTSPDVGLNMELKQALISQKPLLALAQKSIGYDEKYQKLLRNVIGYDGEEEFRNIVETFVRNYETKGALKYDNSNLVIGTLNENKNT